MGEYYPHYNQFALSSYGSLKSSLPCLSFLKSSHHSYEFRHDPELLDEVAKLSATLVEAQKIVQIPEDSREVYKRWRKNGKIFNGIKDISTEIGGTLLLRDSPAQLKEMIARAENYKPPSILL